MPRGTAAVVLAIFALAGAVASTSVRADTASAPRSGWSGTIVDNYTYHQDLVKTETSRTKTDWTIHLEIIVENGVATASGTYSLVQDETYFWKGCNLPPGHSIYTWTVRGSGPVSFDVQHEGSSYQIFTGTLFNVPGTLTHTDNGHDRACKGLSVNESQPFDQNLSVSLPMTGTHAPGAVTLEGSRDEPVPSQCGGSYDSCSGGGTHDVTWTLVRTKKLTFDKLGLFDRDPLYGVRTKPEQRTGVRPKEFTPLQFLSASPHSWDPGTVVCFTMELDGFADDSLKSMKVSIPG
ncbi:MAG: hypothetical protein H0W87_08545, partial [Actinobacteria bacterium]|nr:hypothetical protein [Actinomycetota bacterium]